MRVQQLKNLLILAILTILTTNLNQVSCGIFSSKGDVKLYNIRSLKGHLGKSLKGTMVAFYAPWCGHCRSLQPEFERAATNLKNIVNFVAVDCDSDENKAACSTEYQVRGYPTLKYFAGNPIPIEYQDQRKSSSMIEFSKKNMPNFTKRIKNFDQLSNLIEKSSFERPLVVLFTKSTSATALFKSLSSAINKKMDVYISSDSSISLEKLKESFKIDELPKVLIFNNQLKPKTEEKEKEGEGDGYFKIYSGKINYDDLFKFFKDYSEDSKSKKDQLDQQKVESKVKDEL